MILTRYKVTWRGKTVHVSSTYYMGAIQKAAEHLCVPPREISREAVVQEMYKHTSVKR